MEGFVSKACGLFLFLADIIAAAAAIPTGPVKQVIVIFFMWICTISPTKIYKENGWALKFIIFQVFTNVNETLF